MSKRLTRIDILLIFKYNLKLRDMKDVLKLSAVFLVGSLPTLTALCGGLCLMAYMFKDVPSDNVSYGALIAIVCSSFVLAIILFLAIILGVDLAEKVDNKLNY